MPSPEAVLSGAFTTQAALPKLGGSVSTLHLSGVSEKCCVRDSASGRVIHESTSKNASVLAVPAALAVPAVVAALAVAAVLAALAVAAVLAVVAALAVLAVLPVLPVPNARTPASPGGGAGAVGIELEASASLGVTTCVARQRARRSLALFELRMQLSLDNGSPPRLHVEQRAERAATAA